MSTAAANHFDTADLQAQAVDLCRRAQILQQPHQLVAALAVHRTGVRPGVGDTAWPTREDRDLAVRDEQAE